LQIASLQNRTFFSHLAIIHVRRNVRTVSVVMNAKSVRSALVSLTDCSLFGYVIDADKQPDDDSNHARDDEDFLATVMGGEGGRELGITRFQ
jgi:chromosome condensin MukBEF ATPase and DNA-binding subunit MukB